MEPIVLKPSDACPNCGGAFEPARTLTVADYQRAFNRDDPQVVPARTDTMHPDQVAEHGKLYLCTRCDYATRFK